MHQNGYFHGDLKLENILIDDQFNLKLADFGFASKLKTSSSCKGTFGYMAPELIEGQEYDCAQADLFASAVILFILLTQHPPFDRAQNNDKHYRRIINEDWTRFWHFYEDNISETFKDLFKNMVSADPSERFNMQQVKDHPWFNGPVASYEEVFNILSARQRILAIKRENIMDYENIAKQASECDEDEPMQSETKEASVVVESPVKTRYTRLFNVTDGDEILDVVIDIASQKGYDYEKSDEYFQVTLFVCEKDGKSATITVHVLKSQKNVNSRCLKFMLTDGNTSVFNKCFAVIKKYVEENFI